MSDKVIKSENVEFVNPAERELPEFVRLYSKQKGNVSAKGKKKRTTGNDSSGEAQSESEMEKATREAYAKGYTEGITKGTEDEKSRLFLAAEALTKSIRELDRVRREILEGNEDRILDIVFSVSEKVINQEVSANRDTVYSVLKSAIKLVLDKEEIKVRMNSDDYRYIMEINPGFIDSFEDIRNMTVVEDNRISRGGIVIETPSGEVDARLEQQLHEIKKAMSAKK